MKRRGNGQKISSAVTEKWGLGFERDGFLPAGLAGQKVARKGRGISGKGPRMALFGREW